MTLSQGIVAIMDPTNNRLAVIAPTVEGDLTVFFDNMKNLESQLIFANIDFIFIVIFQTKNVSLSSQFDGLTGPSFYVIHSTVLNVSHARNLGLEFIEKFNFKGRVLFLDSTICFDKTVWDVFKSQQLFCMNLWFCRIIWAGFESVLSKSNEVIFPEKMTVTDVFYGSYVWSAFFSANLLRGLRFDERFGVGMDAIFQGGEDVLFITDVFLKNNSEAYFLPGCRVYHPPRPLNFSKHLKYARGSGAMFGSVIYSRKPGRYRLLFCIYFLLSICNSLLRCIFFRKYATQILRLRISGFLDYRRHVFFRL